VQTAENGVGHETDILGNTFNTNGDGVTVRLLYVDGDGSTLYDGNTTTNDSGLFTATGKQRPMS
jgi:hypothetical protein